MRRLLLFFFLVLPTLVEGQSLGRFAGRISNAAGKPLEGVSVVDQAGRFATLTDGQGCYVLDKVPLGAYVLITRSLGHAEARREVVLSAENPTATVDFTLQASTNAVQEVEVLGRQETTYKSNYSLVGTRTSTDLIDVPQSISTVTKELMEDR
jgi:iron complex outermembrane receptor protein